jgi:adhesin/invasin
MARSFQFGVAVAAGLGAAVVAVCGGAERAAADCPTYNAPNTLELTGGTPQSAKLGSMFGDNLQVALANTNGCPLTTPVAGIAITFVAPSTGPSGTFASSGANAVLVGTNASGSAAAPAFTANTLPGGYPVVASSEDGSVTFSLVNTASGVPATVGRLSPARQTATAGAPFAEPLEVLVLDATGNPVPGASVTFALGSGAAGSGAGGSSASAGASFAGGSAQANETTNASGIATSPSFEANATAGKFSATATVAGVTDAVSFSLDNLAGRALAMARVGSAHGSATVGARYRSPLRVKVLGSNGKPLLGATVTFALGSSGGSSGASGSAGAGASFVGGSAQATATTNAAGLATSPRFEANTTAGTFSATAALAGSSAVVSFSLRNTAGRPATIAAGVGSTESTGAGARFPIRLAVTVTDAHANPVDGALVTFSAPMHGASGSFGGSHGRSVSVRTNTSGVAVAPVFRANRKRGGYIVKAAVEHARPAAFALVNEPPGQS